MGNGIPYFSLDCQLDDKFGLIEAEYGIKGFAVVVKLYQKIYGEEGYYCEWTKEVELLFSRRIGFPAGDNSVSEILNTALKRGIFSKELYEKYGILTSKGIQERYLKAVQRRVNVPMLKEYLLIRCTQNYKNVDISEENVDIKSKNAYISEQSKVKKSKEKYSKEEREYIGNNVSSVPSISNNKRELNNDACASPSSRFIKPTIQDIRAYCLERHNNVDAEVFFDFYESKNWMIGKSKMKDWRAAVRTWEKRQIQEKKEEIKNPYMRRLIELNEHERNDTGFISDIFSVSSNVESR